jgi:hypothetical protein
VLELKIWKPRDSDGLEKVRIYVNGHGLDQPGNSVMKIWFERAPQRKSLKAVHRSRLTIREAMMNEQLYQQRELIVHKVMRLYTLDPEDKLLWYKLLCVADWPPHMDRTYELDNFRKTRLRRKSKPNDLKQVKQADDDKRRRRVIKD